MRPAPLPARALAACLMTTSALVAPAGLPAGRAAAQGGAPCVMTGNACVIGSTGFSPNEPPPPGGAGNGQPGGPASALASALVNPTGLANDGFFAPLDMFAVGGIGDPGATGEASGGGWGGNGGAGGDLTLSVSAAVTNTPNGQSDAGSAVSVVSQGGHAGGGAMGANGIAGQSGTGGDGGTITVDALGGQWLATSSGSGASIQSVGGTGGEGGDYLDEQNKYGVDGGTGGNGGLVTATLTGSYIGFASGVHVASAGGDGGQGGKGDEASSGQGGNGGTAGNGQTVSVTLASGASIEAGGPGGAGLWAQSVGGQGGLGGGGEIGGFGGAGGDAGDVNVVVNGQIQTMQPSDPGSPSPGVLAQSIGNVGGGGGHASDWSFDPTGGNGGSGGTPGTVTVTGTGANIATGNSFAYGDLSPGVLAQSIGGMGGVGPDESGIFAIGGNGGDASNGDSASAALTDSTIKTIGFGAGGIVAQSVGGGGGAGGDATTTKGTLVNMDIGGTGGNGGAAGPSYAANLGGSVSTSGDHSPGVVMQSVGGGGGSGGAAYGSVSSKIYGAQISVGGNGGAGGDGGYANPDEIENNSGRIATSGAESFGILAQSIGGGGGKGGASTAKAIVKGSDDYPSFTLTMATGGDGGTAGDAAETYAQSTGLITTTGNGAIGILAQSIGGGGGTGGDADAASKSSGGNFGLTAAIAHGGKGQSGGVGDLAWAQNAGLIITTGESADGMLIQSIGGGGGNGGSGDAKASDSADDASISLSLGIGGQGGAGGSGATVKGNNAGSILTLGDGANGLAVQTIGGGGGRGGGAAASASGTISAQVSLGGSGGNGGDTYYTASDSAVTNSGSIVTFGADAAGIVAQSIGGGGGIGGKAGTSLGDAKNNGDGSNGSDAAVGSAIGDVQADYAANGSGALANYTSLDQLLTTTNKLLGNSTVSAVADGDDIDDLDDTSETGGDTDDDNQSDGIRFGVNIGGSGGSGGAAGLLAVTNSGTVATMGRHSDAIVVQAIGGGGGKGGAASTASSGDMGGSVNIGGNGGDASDPDANNGGQPTVTNAGTVYTVGALSSGIVAQSIAGGGGIGGTSSVTVGTGGNEQSSPFAVNLGGLAKVANGMGEIALVENTGAIETRGHDSYGIIAQSISGGGGIVKTLATNLDSGNGSGNSASSKVFDVDLSLGADGNTTSGVSGAVFVTNDTGGSIVTSGDNGVGILAQSVAGGGGLALGGRPTGTTAAELLGSGTKTGDVNQGSSTDPADNQGVDVTVNGSIATSGAGGVGVFAQSVGGGGGIAGDLGNSMDFDFVGSGNVASSHIGKGGDIAVTVAEGASITTTNKNAPGIIAQSVGGGGGWFAGDTLALVGTAGGNGTGGDLDVTLDGTVNAGGSASAGIIVQSTGGADRGGAGAPGTVSVTIGTTGSLWGGAGGFLANQAALYVLGAGAGSGLSNSGVINTNNGSSGYAVYVDPRVAAGNFTVTNQRNATITGDVDLPSSNFLNYGNYFPLATVALGDATLVNAGTVDLTEGARVTRLAGDFRGTARSRLAVGADFVNGTADRLAVSGTADLGGGVAVRPSRLVPGTVTVLTAGNSLDGQSLADATGAWLFDFTPKVAGTAVTVTPSADFSGDGLSRDETSLASHLQRVWDGDHPETMAKGFAALAGITSTDDYADTLDRLASRQVGAIATARMESSRLFVANMQSCPVFAGSSLMLEETDCAWGRAISAHLDHDGSTDAAGFDNDATLVQFGGQRTIGDALFLAGAVGWENARLKDDFGASADGESWMAGVGVKYQSGPLLASATFDAGYGSFDTTRSFTVGDDSFRAEGAPDARNAGLHGRIAYELPQDGFYLRPSLDLDASWIGLGSYDEAGAGDFGLSVDDSDSWVLSASPAVEVGTRVDLADGTVLRPFANVGARFVSGNDWTVDASFAAAPGDAGGFSSRIDNPDAVATLGAGVTVMTRGNLDLTAQYQGAFADGYSGQSGALKATWRF